MNMIPLVSACVLLGVLAPVSSGEFRPTLKFAGAEPATVAIEEAFKMALDNLIDINSILKGHPIESLTLRDIRIKFPGNGLATDSLRSFGEKAGAYPEFKMFAQRLPAYGFYFWHVRGLSISDMALTTDAADGIPCQRHSSGQPTQPLS